MSKVYVGNVELSKNCYTDKDSVFLSVHDEGECGHRRDRLNRVIGYLGSKFNCNHTDFRTKHGLLALHDHKGQLTCVWVSFGHMINGIKHVKLAWNNEYEHFILIHYFNDSKIITVGGDYDFI